MNADPANAARDVNLTGLNMGKLRTANNRRNRAIRQTVLPTHASPTTTTVTDTEAKAASKTPKAAS